MVDFEREQPESPDWLNSGGSLCPSLTTYVPVLASPAFVQLAAPFSPTLWLAG